VADSWIAAIAARMRARAAGLLISVMLLVPSSARAIEQTTCESLRVFGGAAVNVALFPYTYTGKDRRQDLSEAARNISLLVQLDVLGAARYGSIGITRVLGEDPVVCDPKRLLGVLRRGEASGPHGELRAGGGVVALWGQFFETAGTLYVQSYLSFFRHQMSEDLELPLTTPAGDLEFIARLPAQQVAFRPRPVEFADLENINRIFYETSTIREAPDPSAPPVQAEPFDVQDFAYGVEFAGDGWLRLIPYADLPEGYVRLGGETSNFLKRLLPELSLLDAVVGYLTHRVANESEAFEFTPAPDIPVLLERSSENYREVVDAREEPLPVTLAYALPAAAQLLDVVYHREESLEAAGAVLEGLDSAVELLPDNADLLNIHAIARTILCCSTGSELGTAAGIEGELHRAMVVAPANPRVVTTLENLYQLLMRLPDRGELLSQSDLEQRITSLENLRHR